MIETARLILRPYREADRAPFHAMVADPEVMHDSAPMTPAEADVFFARRRDQIENDGFGKWAIERRADGGFLGFAGVSHAYHGLPIAPALEVGWRLARHAWRHGYAAEAARASITDTFQRTGAAEILSFTLPTNTRSLAVMQRLGFRRDAARDFTYETGLPAVVYAMARTDWNASREPA
jgi:RimJ/RimL family protein N-acetyltransferase